MEQAPGGRLIAGETLPHPLARKADSGFLKKSAGPKKLERFPPQSRWKALYPFVPAP
jgi:hypothetical protein